MRPFRFLALYLLATALVLHAFAAFGTRGLITPDGKVARGLVLLAVLTLAMRLGAVFIVPALAAHRLLRRVLRPAPPRGARSPPA